MILPTHNISIRALISISNLYGSFLLTLKAGSFKRALALSFPHYSLTNMSSNIHMRVMIERYSCNVLKTKIKGNSIYKTLINMQIYMHKSAK